MTRNEELQNESEYFEHHGILGQRWGVRRYQNYDGTLINPKGFPQLAKNEGLRQSKFKQFDKKTQNMYKSWGLSKGGIFSSEELAKWNKVDVNKVRSELAAAVRAAFEDQDSFKVDSRNREVINAANQLENSNVFSKAAAAAAFDDKYKNADYDTWEAAYQKVDKPTDQEWEALNNFTKELVKDAFTVSPDKYWTSKDDPHLEENLLGVNTAHEVYAIRKPDGKTYIRYADGYTSDPNGDGDDPLYREVYIPNVVDGTLSDADMEYLGYRRLKHSGLDELEHHGILGQRWGVRRYQNYDGTLIHPKTNRKRRAAEDVAYLEGVRKKDHPAYNQKSKQYLVAKNLLRYGLSTPLPVTNLVRARQGYLRDKSDQAKAVDKELKRLEDKRIEDIKARAISDYIKKHGDAPLKQTLKTGGSPAVVDKQNLTVSKTFEFKQKPITYDPSKYTKTGESEDLDAKTHRELGARARTARELQKHAAYMSNSELAEAVKRVNTEKAMKKLAYEEAGPVEQFGRQLGRTVTKQITDKALQTAAQLTDKGMAKLIDATAQGAKDSAKALADDIKNGRAAKSVEVTFTASPKKKKKSMQHDSIDIQNAPYLAHHGVLGQKWGVRRYQNYDGTLIHPKTGRTMDRYYKNVDNAQWVPQKASYDYENAVDAIDTVKLNFDEGRDFDNLTNLQDLLTVYATSVWDGSPKQRKANAQALKKAFDTELSVVYTEMIENRLNGLSSKESVAAAIKDKKRVQKALNKSIDSIARYGFSTESEAWKHIADVEDYKARYKAKKDKWTASGDKDPDPYYLDLAIAEDIAHEKKKGK